MHRNGVEWCYISCHSFHFILGDIVFVDSTININEINCYFYIELATHSGSIPFVRTLNGTSDETYKCRSLFAI